MSWVPLHCHSTYSCLDGLSKPEDIAERCTELGYQSCALTDHGVISGVPPFFKSLKKKSIKPISGQEFYLSQQDSTIKDASNRYLTHLCVLAKDYEGWKRLMRASSAAFHPDNSYYKPRLNLEKLASYSGGHFIVFSGHMGSDLADACFNEPKLAYNATNLDEVRSLVRKDWKENVCKTIRKYQELFGKENFYVEIQLIDEENLPASRGVAQILRTCASLLNVPTVATSDSHYCRKEDAGDQRLLLCTALNVTMGEVYGKIQQGEDVGLATFFKSNNYHIPTLEEMRAIHTPEELQTAVEIANRCEAYELGRPPLLPVFDCPDGKTPDEYLKDLCREGWKKHKMFAFPAQKKEVYQKRLVEVEYPVLTQAKLSSYFLIVQDYIKYATEVLKVPIGLGRGCLAPKTPIVLSNGTTKPISKIGVGDNVVTRDGSIRQVIKTWEYDVDEELVSIKSNFGDSLGVELTSDHKVLVEKCVRPEGYYSWAESTKKARKNCEEPIGDLKWIPAAEIERDDWVFIPKPQVEIIKDVVFDLGKYAEGRGNERLVCVGGSKVNHKNFNPLTGGLVFNREQERYLSLDCDFAYFLGMFAGNGWLHTANDFRIGVAFNTEHVEKIQWCMRFLKRIGASTVNARVSKKGTLTQVNATSPFLRKLIADLFCEYKHTPQTKHIPQCIIQAEEHIVKSFIEGLIDTDGSQMKCGRLNITSSSKKLAEQSRFLLFRLGVPSSFRKEKRFDEREEFYGEHIAYYVRFPSTTTLNRNESRLKPTFYRSTKEGLFLKVRSVVKKRKKCKVYDLEIERNHNFLTSSFIVHNSAAGCLVSYLLGITGVDPIKYNLLFERFYNAGRLSEGRTALPDIDTDFPVGAREPVIKYLKEKYGEDKVCGMATFTRMQGRGALKDVLRAHNRCSFDEMNRITKYIPDEARIADELQHMRDEGEEASIILWALENHAEQLKDWCELKDGELSGPLSLDFAQAIRLEGTKRNLGKHASAVVICSEPLAEICPMLYDKHGDFMTAVEMGPAEELGLVKFDILGLNTLDKMKTAENLIRTGRT